MIINKPFLQIQQNYEQIDVEIVPHYLCLCFNRFVKTTHFYFYLNSCFFGNIIQANNSVLCTVIISTL